MSLGSHDEYNFRDDPEPLNQHAPFSTFRRPYRDVLPIAGRVQSDVNHLADDVSSFPAEMEGFRIVS
jgi:hypothetical protein